MVTRSLGALDAGAPTASMVGKEDEMTPASKATATKKLPASRTTVTSKAVPSKKGASKKAAPVAKKVTSTKGTTTQSAPTTKKSPPTKKAVPTKNAQAAKKPAPPAKSGGAVKTVKKEATTTKKVAPAAKKVAGPPKKAASAPKPAAPVDTGIQEIAPEAPPPVRSTFTPKPKPPVPVRPKTGPYAKDVKFLEEISELLAEERAIYQEQATSLRAEADSLALEREPGDVQFDEESGEGGTVTVDRERNLALSGQAALAVEEIDYAAQRVADKSYGYCERCFQPIPKPRLRALPYARLCVACKSGGLSRR
jgi:DnaK suppressor protein